MEAKIRYTYTDHHNVPLYLDSIGYNPKELDFERPEGYPYYHWLQTIHGEGVVTCIDQTIYLKQGEGLLLPPYTAHSYHPNYDKTKTWSTVYATFGGEAVDKILDCLSMNQAAVYQEQAAGVFKESIDRVFQFLNAQQKETISESFIRSSYMYDILMTIKQYGQLTTALTKNQSFSKVRPIVDFLEANFQNNIGLQEMSMHAHLSPQHINKLFHETFGLSPYAFLVQLRMREAKRLLLTDVSLTLREIAELVGYNAVSHFVSTFKTKTGMTPKHYRETHKKD